MMFNRNRIEKGKRAAATQGFIYVLRCVKSSLLKKCGDTSQQTNQSLDHLTLVKMLIGFPKIYFSLENKVSWQCAKKWSRKFLKDDIGFKGILLFWIVLNYNLWLFKWYLYENNLTTQEAQHAYHLLTKQILPAITSDYAPTGLLEIKRINDISLKNYNWQTFIGSSGSLLNDNACILLTALFCINNNDIRVFSRLLVDVTKVVKEDHEISFQKIEYNVNKLLKSVRDWLEGYCNKMCLYTAKTRNLTGVEKWNLSKQVITAIRAKSPCVENEHSISRLVEEFRQKTNEAGALTCAAYMVSLEQLAKMPNDSLEECKARIKYFKDCIELHDVYNLIDDDTNERDLQRLFRLVWYGSEKDVNQECENGLGACDYAVSFGAKDKCIIEIKLGSNSSLKQGLKHQLDVYKKVNGTPHGIYLVLCKNEREIKKCRKIAKECNLIEGDTIYIIDASKKVPASKRR